MRLKKWSAILLAGVMLLGFTGCMGNLYENVMTVDGTEISSGMYLMMQQAAYNEAESKKEDEEKSVFKQDIDGVSAKKWIRERTEELCREMVCVERLASENGVYLSEASTSETNSLMESYWSLMQESYAEMGISETSFRHYMAFTSLKSDLFDALYAPGGEFAVPDATLKQEYAEKNARIKFASVPVHELETQTDRSEDVMKLVNQMVAKMNAGTPFDEVIVGSEMQQIYEMLGRQFDADSVTEAINPSYYRSYEDGSGVYSEEFLAELKEQPVGAYGAYSMGYTIMIYEKLPLFEDDAAFDAMRTTVLRELRYDEYEAYLKTIYDEYPVSKAFLAEWYFSPTKMEKDS